MPFRVLGLDFMDLPTSVISWPGVRQSVPFLKGARMLTLKDPILTERPSPVGIELPPLHQPDSLEMAPSVVVEDRMVLTAVKRTKSFDWAGSRSAVHAIVRQMEKYGWAVTVREEGPRHLD